MEQLNQNKKWIAIVELLASLILSILLIPIGFVYSLLIEPFLYPFNSKFFKYLRNFFVQIYNVLMFLFHSIAYSIDLFGNVIFGNFLELFITQKQDTLFGKSKHSISQALGFLQKYQWLNKRGVRLVKLINKIFGDKHCINAYEYYVQTTNNK